MRTRISSEFVGEKLVGAVSTYYKKGDPRFDYAVENAENYDKHTVPLVVIDGSPDDNRARVRKALELRGALVVESLVNGIATQRQQGVGYAIAHGAEKVVGHEPEKVLMSDFATQITDALDEYDILTIGRTNSAIETLPSIQAWTESMAGYVLQKTHHLPPDTLSGGRGFTLAGAEVLARYPSTQKDFNNWIYLYYTILEARAEQLPTGGIKIDLNHPPLMTSQEEGSPVFDRKRFDQFKLQFDYLLQRGDVDPVAQKLAAAVIYAMDGLTDMDTNDTFKQQLKRLEHLLVNEFGYKPTRAIGRKIRKLI